LNPPGGEERDYESAGLADPGPEASGPVVDLAARLVGTAAPNQVVIDLVPRITLRR